MSHAGEVPRKEPPMKYIRWTDVELEHLNPLLDRQMGVGEEVMVARVLLKKGAHVPMHHHVNEQITYILEGAPKFSIGGTELAVHSRGGLCTTPDLAHRAWA